MFKLSMFPLGRLHWCCIKAHFAKNYIDYNIKTLDNYTRNCSGGSSVSPHFISFCNNIMIKWTTVWLLSCLYQFYCKRHKTCVIFQIKIHVHHTFEWSFSFNFIKLLKILLQIKSNDKIINIIWLIRWAFCVSIGLPDILFDKQLSK